MLRTFALHALAAAVLLSGGVAHAQLQTTAQQKCLINVTNAGLKVARAEGKQIRSCVRAAVRGDLLASDGLGCVTSDPRGKIQGARTKTLLAAARSCIVTPGFGFTDAPTVNTAAVDEDIALTVDIFGPSLVEAAILHVVDRDGASCQSKVQGAYEKLFTAKLRHFASCQKRGLSFAQISSGADLSECVEEVKLTTDVKIEKARAKLLSTIQRSCTGLVAIRDAFPGRCDSALNSTGLSACLDQAVDCRTCTMMAVSYALPIDCDEFDDGAANGSCIEGIHTTPTTLPPGEGACTNPEDETVLSSVNIQTITRNCTLGCLTSETRPQCIALCIANQTGLGAECSLCYADSSECGIQNCAGPCALSQTSPACLSCLETTGCIAAFDECAGGVPVTTTTEPPPTTTLSTTTTTVEPGACANPADEAVDNAYDLQAETTACTLTCLSAGNLQQCVAACLAAETGLSTGCSSCYAGSAQCGLENCAAECAVNQSSPACLACLETNCVPGFDQCAFGTPTTTLDTTTTTIPPTTTTIGGGTTTTLPPMEGECTNPADEAVISSVDIQTETRDCTLTCLSASDVAQCTADCLVNNIELSPGCALCYGESSECGIQFCAAQCAVNQNAPACIACLNANCIPAFNECAGTGNVTTTTIDTTTTTSTTTTTMPPTGACDNPADITVDDAYDLEAQSTTCMVSCLSAPNRPACVAACVSSATGLSSPCSSCYGQSAECGLQNCAGVCATNQSAPPCRACLEVNCIPAFNACSGLGDPPAPATCTNLVQDGTETDIDCGGLCEPCPIGDTCTVGDDCISGECVSGTCVPPQTEIPLGSCVDGYIDPTTDADAIDLGGLPATGADDGYKVVLPSFTDVFIEVTNLLNGTTELRAALVTTPSNPATAVMSTGAVVPGQNGTSGPTTLSTGTRYLYVDSAVADTYGPYRVCVLPAPTITLGSCVTGNVGNGDGNNVQIAGPTGAGGDRGIRFIPAVDTNVRLRLRNVSGGSKMAAALFRNSTIVSNSETPDAILFTERTAGPAFVTGGDLYNVQVDLADADTFGTFELCLVQAGCGDEVKDGGEACDDGNNTNGDGCSSTCALESGKIVVDSCRTDNIPLFGSDCDDWTLPILENESVFVEVTNPAGGTLLARAELRLGGALLSQSGNIPIGQTGSTAVTAVTAPNDYTARVCDVTGAGTGNYTVCVRSARRLDLGECFSSNVTDGDGNVIDLAGPISGGDEDVIFQPPATTTVKLTMSHDGGGGLLASGIYNGQPGSLLPGSAVGQSPSPIPVGGSGTSGLVAVNGAQIYRVYTDIASLGTAGNNYTICVAEVEGDTCLNPEDEAVRAAYNLNAEAEAAGLSCTGNASCISSTLQNDTGLSPECADCYGSVGGCAASNCAFQCLGDSGSSGCRNCVTSNCAAEFEICSGWTYGQ